MQAGFKADARLLAETVFVADLSLSRVFLMDDQRYPWLILVPRRPDLVELTDLDEDDAQALMHDIRASARALKIACPYDKLNVGALGNVVRQLHVHLVGRQPGDAAGLGPVWGVGSRIAMTPIDREGRLAALVRAFGF